MIIDQRARLLKDVRISVTDRCNFRCPYCMPQEIFGDGYEFLPRAEILTFEEIARVASLFVRLGASKLRLTGGEPLLRAGLPTLIGQLASIDPGLDLTLTTNGHLLPRHAGALAAAGLSRVTVSLDSLDPGVFRRMSGRDHGPELVLEGIRAAERSGLSPVKINTVVMRGVNEDGILDLAERFRGTPHVLRFIEYMDVGTVNGWKMDHVVPADEIIDRIDAAFPLEPLDANYPGEVASRYRYADGAGEIGIIASVTRPFCGGCTRARLSTDGRLYTCLFATEGTDLKGPLRAGAGDDVLLDRITGTWSGRTDNYSEERTSRTDPPPGKVEMHQIGG